jgi:hypothetical protein
MRTISSKSNNTITPLVEQLLAAGEISRQEHLNLASMLLSGQRMTDKDRCQINRVFDYVQTGRLKLVD